ncbi:lactonase family protein [Granulicella sp. WH15]|uniref:lactonase family protein n=1 Tax=Granulicella sp. WH15 TaxID=2602070 RepID=UPI001366FEF9|nr:beta-propeller fold lactonase family protein [Granulicella sp. WH15]QHN04141.1 lactonase family protein [Granulicella sp. WH15]
MKWTKLGRGAKALAVSLALGLGVTACSRDFTVAYLYVTTAKTNPGLINAFTIDYQLGSLVPLADSPIPSGGKNPVGLVVSTNTSYTKGGQQFVYVINHDDSSVVQFSIGTDGKLFQANTYDVVTNASKSIVGSLPTGIAMDSTDTFLYVTFTYQNGFSPAKTGPGGVAVFPINTDGTLGTPVTNTSVGTTAANPLPYFPVGNNPVAVSVANSFCLPDVSGVTYTTKACTTTAQAAGHLTIPSVYVIDQDSVGGVPTGVIMAFQQGVDGSGNPAGNLVPVNGPLLGGYKAGSVPSAIAVEPTGRYVYVTDRATNQVFGDVVGANGILTPMVNAPFATGVLPMGITVDPRGLFVYVSNFSDSSVSGYAINTANGALSASGSATQTGTGPTCVTIDPAVGKYVYTSNNLDNSVSGMQLNPTTGALTQIQGTPYPASGLPSCAAAAASSSHATQVVTP